MKQVSKNVISFAMAFFFASAVFCATLAAPSQSLASVSGCSQRTGMKMTDCEHPSYVCGFDPSSTLHSQGALTSVRSHDSLEENLSVTVGELWFDSSAYSDPFGNEHTNASSAGPHKVSIHLYNSVLTL